MKKLWLLSLSLPLFAASTVPDRYIVQLSTPSVAQQAHALHSLAAGRHRVLIRAEQTAVRARIRQAQGTVRAALENIQNALIVDIPDSAAASLSSIPGVKKVYPVRTVHRMLDHALPLHHVPQAWTQVGIDNAGAGVRIAIIDSGVDVSHPGFQDAGLTAPEGFPRAGSGDDLKFTNNKIIVARSYAWALPNPDPDLSPADHIGHGTATAMAAAGIPNTGPLAIISGVAPRAYIGNYKVFGTPGVNDTTTEDVLLMAIDDAAADGMDVINLSLGTDIALPVQDDPQMQALENVAALGIVVVAAAGNNGPDPMTTGTPAAAPSVIAVGASANDRIFSATVLAPGGRALVATPAQGAATTAPIAAPIVDVGPIDGSGLACDPLPPRVLSGAIALISRGTCPFETKLNHAQASGAAGAIVYDNVDGESPIMMAVGSATLPAEMISYQDGLALKQQSSGPVQVTMQFSLGPAYTDPARLAPFSAVGPNIDFSIKPDMVAVGMNLYTAAQRLDPHGAIYDADGYSVEQGTSFSAPIVSGAAAVLKAARPGLSAPQYRSLLVNTSAPAAAAHVQQAGAGMLDLLAALNATAAAAPVSLSFGSTSGTADVTRQLTISNLGAETDTFRIAVAPLAGSAVPAPAVESVDLDPGASATVPVRFAAAGLTAGQYEGFVTILGSHSSVATRVPYWFAAPTGRAQQITVVYAARTGAPGSSLGNAVLFRVTDDSGLPVADVQPSVSAVAGGGRVTAVRPAANVPYAFSISGSLGPRAGSNVFRIQVGDVTKDVTILGQ